MQQQDMNGGKCVGRRLLHEIHTVVVAWETAPSAYYLQAPAEHAREDSDVSWT